MSDRSVQHALYVSLLAFASALSGQVAAQQSPLLSTDAHSVLVPAGSTDKTVNFTFAPSSAGGDLFRPKPGTETSIPDFQIVWDSLGWRRVTMNGQSLTRGFFQWWGSFSYCPARRFALASSNSPKRNPAYCGEREWPGLYLAALHSNFRRNLGRRPQFPISRSSGTRWGGDG